MIKIDSVVIVEGKYDKIRLQSVIDATIISTDGFGIFKNKEKMNYIRNVAKKRGIIILTDSDSAGFMIRSHILSCVPNEFITNVYIPDIFGKERRKVAPSKEGKLGVEGVSREVIESALIKAGISLSDDDCVAVKSNEDLINKADFFVFGLSGQKDSALRRKKVQKAFDLPENLSANGLLQAVNVFFSKEEFYEKMNEIFGDKNGK